MGRRNLVFPVMCASVRGLKCGLLLNWRSLFFAREKVLGGGSVWLMAEAK